MNCNCNCSQFSEKKLQDHQMSYLSQFDSHSFDGEKFVVHEARTLFRGRLTTGLGFSLASCESNKLACLTPMTIADTPNARPPARRKIRGPCDVQDILENYLLKLKLKWCNIPQITSIIYMN